MSDSKPTELHDELESLFCRACRKLHMNERASELFDQELAKRVEEAIDNFSQQLIFAFPDLQSEIRKEHKDWVTLNNQTNKEEG